MVWQNLLQAPDEHIVSPWIGGRVLRTFTRTWRIDGRLPRGPGWHKFRLSGRKARWVDPADPDPGTLLYKLQGYLAGDRFVPDSVMVVPGIGELANEFERVYLMDPGIDRFTRITVGRSFEDGPLIFDCEEFPLGGEDLVRDSFLDRIETVDGIPGVVPALDAVFRIETWRRAEADKRREEERRRREAEERRRKVMESLGDGASRRELALTDFAEAARAALLIGGAVYLDHRPARHPDEMVVRFRVAHQRFACTCDRRTLAIIDAGICLTDHDTGERGDTRFTLESLPSVIREATGLDKLVVFHHVD